MARQARVRHTPAAAITGPAEAGTSQAGRTFRGASYVAMTIFRTLIHPYWWQPLQSGGALYRHTI